MNIKLPVRSLAKQVRAFEWTQSLLRRVFRTPESRASVPPSVWRRLPIHGPFSVRVCGGSQFVYQGRGDGVGKTLFWRGIEGFETGTARPFLSVIEQTDGDFVDVGGYSAYYTLLATLARPDLKAHVFEPTPQLVAWIREHLRINGVQDRVWVMEMAVGECSGTAPLYGTGAPTSPGASLLPDFKQHAKALYEVQTTTLDDALTDVRVGTIKIDVEGGELAVLRGATQLIKAHRPTILCEVLPSEGALSDTAELNAFLKELGYDIWQATPAGPQAVPAVLPDPSRRDRNFFFVPREAQSCF